MKAKFLFAILLLLAFGAWAQDYRDSLHVISASDYKKQIKLAPEKQLIEISKQVPAIQLDIRYATTNNFMHQRMYNQARAFARFPVVKALKAVEAELALLGLGLKIYDAYRPYSVTVQFYKKASDKNFVANPKKGSKHNRGCAVDLSLIDLKTGKELDMPTPFDSFSPMAAADYPNLPAQVLKNRLTLKTAMEHHGFRQLSNEWWHFDFIGWQNFELLDVPFGDL
ncbi:D-alanyl-D-alanine dipeptidase [Mucilaginibacter sp. PPCGB 2223]|uniref:M15 family metallopeptidase n=1 Tax=Mucilaginibacter sp. PPCGB 2223 TaxID=1886027 RepID=UPI000826C151|nr:M15 family metallopeptidase [Mucilaginibacter sp. PPCGB 2223]OCX51138.1 D-alanyl-D-alanine dipeptidase [Mucilaginibacter sp. PPCGB 2223]